MQFTRRSYDDEDQWRRLRHVVDEVRGVAERRRLKLKAPRSAGLRRIRDELEMLGAADPVRREAFRDFGELGDEETLRVFPLEEVPATLRRPYEGLPQGEDISGSMPEKSSADQHSERWYIIERFGDGDTLRFERQRDRFRSVRDHASGREHLETITDRDEIELRLDRDRRLYFTAGGSNADAIRVVKGAVAHAVGHGHQLTLAEPPRLNGAVLHALIDSFAGRPAKTDIAPTDTELLPWKDIGTRQMDIRRHDVVAGMIGQGEQRAVSGVFTRQELGGSNACPHSVEIQVRLDWTMAPRDPVEPVMLLALYDRLVDLARFARLLTPIPRAIGDALLEQLGPKLTATRVRTTEITIRESLASLGLSHRPGGGSQQELFDTVILNLILKVAACGKAAGRPKTERVAGKHVGGILKEVGPSTTPAERERVRHVLDKLTEGEADYLGILKKGEALLAKAGC